MFTEETEPRPGDRVVFMSGRQLGKIDIASQQQFRVMTPEGPVWLKADVIFVREGDRVTLICEPRGLGDFRA
jgi:hypothetical protein